MRSTLSLSCLIGLFTASASAEFAPQAILKSTSGDSYLVDIQPENSFREVIESINEYLTLAEAQGVRSYELSDANVKPWSSSQGFSMVVADNRITIKAASAPAKEVQSRRDYKVLPSAQDKADIGYIVNSLANLSLLKIKSIESSLNQAGDRIDLVHPLHFLAVIFTSEELKVSMRNLEDRSWVWKEFLSGIVSSLAEENAVGEVLPYAQDFAKRIGIDVNLILPTLQNAQWESFVKTLIRVVPRQGNSGRYDM